MTTSAVADQDVYDIEAAAADWVVRVDAGGLSPAAHDALEAWRAADVRHERAYRAASADFAALSRMPELSALMGEPAWQERAVTFMDRVRDALAPKRSALAFAGGLAALAAGVFLWSVVQQPAFETDVAELKSVSLADGSRVTLGAYSRIALDFSAQERRIVLERGEAFFDVAKDASRPFIVTAGATTARAVGTKFDVHRGPQDVRVVVEEGIVDVTTPPTREAAAAATHRLLAGQEIIGARAPDQRVKTAAAVTAAKPAGWRAGRLDYDGAALRDVVADLNRYHATPIALAGEHLGDLKVTISFRTAQINQTLDALAAALSLDVDRAASGRVLLRARGSSIEQADG